MGNEQEMSDNLNWLTTQNRTLLGRVQQLEAILNAVQEQSPEALSFLAQAPVGQEMGQEVQTEEELAGEDKKDTKKGKKE